MQTGNYYFNILGKALNARLANARAVKSGIICGGFNTFYTDIGYKTIHCLCCEMFLAEKHGICIIVDIVKLIEYFEPENGKNTIVRHFFIF